MDERPIGVFDSGFGGLTIVRALIDLLPAEELVYVGDTARYPYGPRPPHEVVAFSEEIARFLVEEAGVKMVVVACNTAASVSMEQLRARLGVPIVGVIEPGLRAAAAATRSGSIGVIGTVGTIASGAHQRAAAAMRLSATLACAACPGFVEFVERGETDSDQVHVLAERLLAPVRAAGVDTLLLACTHYGYLARTLADVMGREVVLVSSAEETAFDVAAILAATGLGRPGNAGPPAHRFLSSGDPEWFAEMGGRLLGPELASAERFTGAGPTAPDAVAR